MGFTKVKYPNDRDSLDEFYQKWVEENKHLIGETWQRPEVYDFASKYAEWKIQNSENVSGDQG